MTVLCLDSLPTPEGTTTPTADLARVRTLITAYLDRDVPLGADEFAAQTVAELWAETDRIRFRALVHMVGLFERGELARFTGYRSLAAWVTHQCGVAGGQAKEWVALAERVRGDMGDTGVAFESGVLSLGEAVAVVKSVDAAVRSRDVERFPEESRFRAVMECGVLAAKRERPRMSVRQIGSLVRKLAFALDPDRAEREQEAAHAARGLSLADTFQGSYQLQAWGSSADALMVRTAVEAFSTPPGEGDTRTRGERDHDALVAALRFAVEHQGCEQGPGPVALIRLIVPVETVVDAQGQEQPATDERGRVVPAGVVRELVGGSLLERVLTSPVSGAVLDVGQTRRVATARQRAAAFHGHQGCAWPGGCDVGLDLCQVDHIRSFSRGGLTVVGNLQPLCGPHNRAKYQREVREEQHTRTKPTSGRAGAAGLVPAPRQG